MAAGEDSLVVVAVILGAHGVRGDLRVKTFTEFPEDALSYGPLIGKDGVALVEPVKVRPAKDHFIVTPKSPRQKEEWDAMKGTLLHVPRSELPEPEGDEIYVEDLIGLKVINPEKQILGTVKAVQNYGAGDLIEVEPEAGAKTVLVPFTEEDVPDIDLSSGRVVVATFDLWTEGSDDEVD
ncbi:MAG: ribosome maturation factor RimM [Pseudomonadota bacterium]